MNYYEIGQRVKKLRKANHLSQEALAEKINISTVHMSHIETGNTKLSLPVFVDLATALGVRTDELLYENDASERSNAYDLILQTLDNCSTQQVKVLADILQSAKHSMNKYL